MVVLVVAVFRTRVAVAVVAATTASAASAVRAL
jgi:hypothetical protein